MFNWRRVQSSVERAPDISIHSFTQILVETIRVSGNPTLRKLYFQMLENEFISALVPEIRKIRQIIQWQQNGVPLYTSRLTRAVLKLHFKDRWTGKFDPIP